MFCKHCGNQVADGTKFCPNCGGNIGETSVPAAQHQQNYAQPMQYGAAFCCPNCGGRELTNISREGTSEYLCFSCGTSFETPDSMRNRAARIRSAFAFKCAIILVVLFIVVAAALVIVYNKYGDRLEYSDNAQEAVLTTWVIISVAGICTAISLVVSYVEKNRESHELIKDAAAFDGLQYDFDRSGEVESQQICCPHCGDTHFAMGNHDEIADIYSFRCKNCLHRFMPPNQGREGFTAYRILYRAKMVWVWCLGLMDAFLLFPIIIDILTIFDSGGGASSSSHRSYLLTLFIMFVPITVAFIMCLVKAVKYNNNANYLYSNADAIELRIYAKKYPDAERVETLEQD